VENFPFLLKAGVSARALTLESTILQFPSQFIRKLESDEAHILGFRSLSLSAKNYSRTRREPQTKQQIPTSTTTILHHNSATKTADLNKENQLHPKYSRLSILSILNPAMPRRSSRPVPASPQAPEAAPKRRASARLSASQPEIKRVKSNASLPGKPVKSTTKKSKYFEPESSEESEKSESPSSESGGDESDSAYEDDKVSDVSSEHDSVPDEPSDSEEDSKKSRPKAKQVCSTVTDEELLKGKELWREGVRTGLGPGKEVFFPKPKARDPGNVPYQDEVLHPNTKLFLQDLAKNNDREWLKGTPDPLLQLQCQVLAR
jgi:hypothetical protein